MTNGIEATWRRVAMDQIRAQDGVAAAQLLPPDPDVYDARVLEIVTEEPVSGGVLTELGEHGATVRDVDPRGEGVYVTVATV